MASIYSFNFRSRSNLKFRNKKIQESRLYGQYEKEKGMDDGDCDNKEKRKKNPWIKWLSFFRRQFIFKKPKSFDLDKYEEKSLNKYENFIDSKIVSCTSSMDIIEIPIQPGQKISKILIKPTKNGIKAIIAQYDGRSFLPLKAKKKFPLINDLSSLKKKRKQFTNRNADKLEMTWNYNIKTINSERKEVPKNENSLMSALYFRKDTDNVESTYFVEPRFSNECMESKKSEDSSQKSVAINRRHISYRIFDEMTDEATKTFKTVSEPTWNEKKKIFHQQRLQENLDELLEQFILLQSDDLINFAAVQNRVKEEKKSIQYDEDESSFNWIEGNDKRVLRRLSRVVSPEILVNIKPFKQYLSGAYINLQEPPIKILKKSKRGTGNQETKVVLKQKCRIQKKSEIQISKNKIENKNLSYHCPVVRSKLRFSGTNNNLKRESSQMKTLVSEQSTKIEENKNKNMSLYILDCDFLAGSNNKRSHANSKAGFPDKTDFCSVWGVYKSYTNLETVDQKKNHVQYKDIDEVLDSFDDKDHDLIFKKNMAQFKRKISSKAFFFEKNSNLSTELLEKPEVNEENFSIKKTGRKTQDLFVFNMKEKKSLSDEDFVKISAKAMLQKINFFNGYKLHKTLATYSWFLLRQMEFCKTMASRVEVSTIKCPRTFKEVDYFLERNIKTVIEKKLSKVSGGETTLLHKRGIKATGCNNDLQCLLNFEYNAKNNAEITFQENDFQTGSMHGVLGGTNSNRWQLTENAAAFMCPRSFLNSTCLNALENYPLTNMGTSGVYEHPKLFLSKKSLKETRPIQVKTLNEQNVVNSLKKNGLAFFETSFRQIHKVVEIINDVTIQYHGKEYMPFKPFVNTAKNFSDTVIVGKTDQTSVSCFTSEIFTVNASSSDDNVLIPKKISNSGNYEINPPIQVGEKLERNSVPMIFHCENITHELVLSDPIKQRFVGKNGGGKEVNKTKSLDDFKFDGFRILYDALSKGSLNDYEDAVTKTVSATSFTMDVSSKFLSSEEKEILCTYDDFLMDKGISMMSVTELGKDKLSLNELQEKPTRSLIQELSKIGISKTIHNKNRSILLKIKSSSSPKENILKVDNNTSEHQIRRSLDFVKDIEKFDVYNYKKKRGCSEKGADIRRTEIQFTGKLGKNKSFITSLRKDESVGADIKLESQLIPDELKTLRTQYKNGAIKPDLKLSVTKNFSTEQKMSTPCMITDKKFFNTSNAKMKMFVLDKNGVNIRKEIVAAFNSIKNFRPCRKEAEEGNKRMSLVIMLSRNK